MEINGKQTKKKLDEKFLREWKKLYSSNYCDILKKYEESNIQVLERKTQDWDGYNPKKGEGLSYGLVITECKFRESDIKNKLRQVLIKAIDPDNFRSRGEGYKIEDVKFFSSNDYNNTINNDMNQLKEAINEVENLKEERFGCIITNNTNKEIYDGSKSINMLDIPQAQPEDVVVRIYDFNLFYSYEFLIIGKDKISDVFFWTCD